jgi:hypothetical protein
MATGREGVQMITVAVLARFEAKPGNDASIQRFFDSGLAIVEGQPSTTMWIAFRIGPTIYGAFAAFANETDRDALLAAGGPKLSREFAELFERPPTFEKADVLKARLPS